jgi:ribosomal protein S12 methylthiotransferase
MKRPANSEDNLERIRRWRAIRPDITIRSTFIAGFPGETDAEFEELLAFLGAAELDRVGCFAYSPVDGAAANALPGHVPDEVKQERRARLMKLQEEISARRLKRYVGTTMKVLVDAVDAGSAIARSPADAPEIDGVVHVTPAGDLKPGDFATVRVTRTDVHDMWAELTDA